jgi:hypothetical protein
MRVPRPAAGMMTNTFIRGDQYSTGTGAMPGGEFRSGTTAAEKKETRARLSFVTTVTLLSNC